MPDLNQLQEDCLKNTDEELVEKALENIEYFACLFNRYEKKLLFYIRRISNFSNEEAEEALQEAFIKVWENLNDFDQSLKFSSWLYRIVHNQTISEYKKSKSFDKDKKEENFDEELFTNLPSKLDIEEEINKEINDKNIKKMLDSLEEKYKNVLILKYWEDKSYDEISDIMKIAPGTVATFINRAKKAFLQLLERQKFSNNF